MAIVTKTLKSSGGDYSLMSTWESTEQTDLVSDGDSHVLECDAFTLSADYTTLAGWTTGASNTITIKAASGQEHNGVVGAGFINTTASAYNQPLQVSNNYVIVEGITLKRTSGDWGAYVCYTEGVTFKKCIFHYTVTGYFSGAAALRIDSSSSSGANAQFQNCIFLGNGRSAQYCSTNRYSSFLNCTFVTLQDVATIVNTGNDYSYYANCAVIRGPNTTTGWSITSVLGTVTYCAALTNPSGTGNVDGLATSDFADYSGGDYSIDDTGSALYDAGTDLSGTFTEDITGYTRVTWDIGAYEYQSAAAASAPPQHKSRRYMQLIQH